MEEEQETTAVVPWSNMPVAPAGFVWVRKDRFAQTRTRNYYPVAEVLSSLEKTTLRGDFVQASFWFYEYVTLGPQFVTSTWAFLFHFTASSVSVADPRIMSHLWTEYAKYKSFLSLDNAPDAVDEELDARCLTIMLQALRCLCDAPKSRVVDSAIRTFLLPFPTSAYVRPFEPHRSLVHVRHTDASQTEVPCSSYADIFDESQGHLEPRFSLFALQEDDPPYLYGWCNALVQSMDTYIARPVDQEAMNAVLYFAGLIYQCTEPCHTRVRRQDSIMILWEIVGKYKARLSEHSSRLVNAYRLAGDEFSKNSHKRERYFAVGALVVLLHELAQETPESTLAVVDVDIRTLATMERIPVPDEAVDYTTKHGLATGATVEGYVRNASQLCLSHDVYLDTAILYEHLRAGEQFKDPKRKVVSMVPFFRFSVRAPPPTTTADATEGLVRKPKTASTKASVKLTDIYTVPRWWYDGGTWRLPWRGQFVPWSPDSKFLSCRAAPLSVLSDVVCLGPQYNAGLFYGNLALTEFERESVVFVPCASSQQAFNQCLMDELKPLFGVPAVGTHCLYLEGTLRKKNKKEDWSNDNMEWDTEGCGSFYVCYRASSFGFSDDGDDDKAQHLSSSLATVLVTETHANQAGNLGKQLLVCATAHEALRVQLIHIFVFYACMGSPGVPLSRILVQPMDGRPLDKDKVLAGDVDELAALATARLVPFYEFSAFANVRFPATFKPLKTVLTKKLLLDDRDNFMQHHLDVMQHLEYANLELVLQTFCTPFVEWAGCVRDNLRDMRSAWLLWSSHVGANHVEQARKRVERNKTRQLEKKKNEDATKKKASVKRAKSEESPEVPKKKLPPPPGGKKVKLVMAAE